MPTITVTWNAVMDQRTCPICREINGHTWVFQVSETPMPDSLIHPKHGIVWDKFVGSKAHGHERFNCRCSIIPHVDVRDIHAKIQVLKNELEAATWTR
jgi:uncharacterized protein with gpF-like domain